MKVCFRLIFLSLCFLSATSVFGLDLNNDIECLTKAYSESLVPSSNRNHLTTADGRTLSYSDNLKESSFDYLLEHSDLKTQMSLVYPRNSIENAPAINFDPGRFRSDSFFKLIYGANEHEVLEHTELVYWAPCKCNIRFSSLNGAARALKAVGDTLGMEEVLSRYVQKSAGSYTSRNIQGTNRKSVHSYAAAVDFALPFGLSKYWLWSGCKDGRACSYPSNILKDKELQRVVKVFEDNGFIWGGKWYHFDTVHFEYRPELVSKTCMLLQNKP